MNNIKTIAVFTSIRSEYGLLKPLLDKINKESQFDLKLLVGGAHLLEDYGMTKNQIIDDGFDITKEFDFLKNEKSPDFITKSMGILQSQLGEWLINNKPDVLIVLGDRFELLPLAACCTVYNIPLVHISGGEITQGAQDNQIRHALTKLAHIHFPATEEYKDNILRMGEEEWRICVSGEPGLDLLNDINCIPKSELYEMLGLDLEKKLIICTFHPETILNRITPDFVKEVLETILQNTDYQILTTAANFDHGGDDINDVLFQMTKSLKNIHYVRSLGQLKYYSVLKCADLMLGNSSSGLVEAQSFNLPVVNVGNRQEGRLVNPNVFQCQLNVDSILTAIKYVVSNEFKSIYMDKPNIYGDGKACDKIIDYLKKVDYSKLLLKRTIFN